MAILLIAEHDGTSLSPQTARLLTAALMMDREVDILVFGHGIAHIAYASACLKGVRKVLCAESPFFEEPLAETVADLVVSLFPSYAVVIADAQAEGKNFMPRVAALENVVQVSGVVDISGPDIFRHLIYSGRAIQTVRVMDPQKVLTIRTSAFVAVSSFQSPGDIVSVSVPANQSLSCFIRNEKEKGGRLDLASAKIVVAGGLALGSAENFHRFILPLAEKLEGAVGASRAAVNAGYAPNDWQVGQTGQIVCPDLYIACGISGAVQHIVGMQDSRIIVAINKDPEAPIFRIANYALVGDLFEILPELCNIL